MSTKQVIQFMFDSAVVKMCLRLRAVLACVTVAIFLHHCNGMPIDQDVDTSPYSFYYKVYDSESNNYQGHVERTADDGSKSGTYYHLAPDGVWYETSYSDDGTGLKSVSNKYDSPNELSVNVFGPEPVRRADEGEITIANGAGVIGGTMYTTDDISDEPVIETRTRFGTGVTEDDVRDSIFGDFPGNRPIVFGGLPGGDRNAETPMTFTPPSKTTGREIVFGVRPDPIPQDIDPPTASQPSVPEESVPLNNESTFDANFLPFDSLFPTPFSGNPNVDRNRIPEGSPPTFEAPSLLPEPDVVEETVLSDPTMDINSFDAGFDTLFG